MVCVVGMCVCVCGVWVGGWRGAVAWRGVLWSCGGWCGRFGVVCMYLVGFGFGFGMGGWAVVSPSPLPFEWWSFLSSPPVPFLWRCFPLLHLLEEVTAAPLSKREVDGRSSTQRGREESAPHNMQQTNTRLQIDTCKKSKRNVKQMREQTSNFHNLCFCQKQKKTANARK